MKLCGGDLGVMLDGWGWGLRGEGWYTVCPSHAEDCFCLSYGPSFPPPSSHPSFQPIVSFQGSLLMWVAC